VPAATRSRRLYCRERQDPSCDQTVRRPGRTAFPAPARLASKSDPRERDRPQDCSATSAPQPARLRVPGLPRSNQLPIAPCPGPRTLRRNRETTHEGFYAGVLSDHHSTPPLTKHQSQPCGPGWTYEVARVRPEIGSRAERAVPRYLVRFPFSFLVFSLTVVLGLRLTVDCLTNRPVIALRPRLLPPPLDLLPVIVSLRCATTVSSGQNSPDVSCKESTQQYPVDDPRLSFKQQIGGSSPRQLPEAKATACVLALLVPRAWPNAVAEGHPRPP
jgi:hypothetical protein